MSTAPVVDRPPSRNRRWIEGALPRVHDDAALGPDVGVHESSGMGRQQFGPFYRFDVRTN